MPKSQSYIVGPLSTFELAVVFVNKIVDPAQTLIEPLTAFGIVVKDVEPF